MSIAILNVNPNHFSTDTVKSLLAEERYPLIERRSHVNINKQRNQVVYDFLYSEHEFGLLLDSDIVFPPGSIDRLYQQAMEHGLYIVSAVYGQPRKDIALVTHLDGTSWPDFPVNALIETGPTGIGFMLVHKSVFQAIEKLALQPEFPWFRESIEHNTWISEDIYFCRRARELDFRIYTDTSLILGHSKAGGVYYPVSRTEGD